MSEPVFCRRCKHYEWLFDQEVCRPGNPVEMAYDDWHRKIYRPYEQNKRNDCVFYEPNRRERLRRWWTSLSKQEAAR